MRRRSCTRTFKELPAGGASPKRKGIRFASWLLIFAILFLTVQAIFQPKWEEGLAATATIDGFYAEDKDTLDVVFFGTSHLICGISPMELYRDYGIKSYVLATGDQPIQTTYYWIREAKKRQKNMVAVVDVWSVLFTDQVTEEVVRQSVDDMHFSANKVAAIRTLCRTYGLKPFDFFFPLFRYHTRAGELTMEDVAYYFQDKHNLFRGHYPIAGYAYSEYQGLTLPKEPVTPVPLREENVAYLKEIVSYCREEGIPLVLTKMPVIDWSAEQHEAIEALAKELSVPYFDMNVAPDYQAIGLDPAVDYQGKDHLNMTGAVKVTKAFGGYLLSAGYISEEALHTPDAVDARWEADVPRYEHAYKSTYLPLVTDIDEFRRQVENDPDYLIFLGYHDAGLPVYSDAYAERLSALWIDPDEIRDRTTKLAKIIFDDALLAQEETDEETLSVAGEFARGDFDGRLQKKLAYEFLLRAGEKEILLNGKECTTTGATGLHVVIYSMEAADTVCEVCFIPVDNGDIYWQVRDIL